MHPESLADAVMRLERPHPALWGYYILRSILSGPFLVFTLVYLYFRYISLRYRFDDEGIHMRVGILFRREVNLTYSRIQDIHLRSGLLQRWLGLANLEVQTASGSAGAELVIEGFKEFEAIRDFLYTRMRGVHAVAGAKPAAGPEPEDVVKLLLAIRDELKHTREIIESRNPAPPPSSSA